MTDRELLKEAQLLIGIIVECNTEIKNFIEKITNTIVDEDEGADYD